MLNADRTMYLLLLLFRPMFLKFVHKEFHVFDSLLYRMLVCFQCKFCESQISDLTMTHTLAYLVKGILFWITSNKIDLRA